MSILMDALKQQQPNQAVAASSNVWRNIALALALLLALLFGAAAGYFLLVSTTAVPNNTLKSGTETVAETEFSEAEPEQILAALSSIENAEKIQAETVKSNDSSQPTVANLITPAVQVETFVDERPVVTVTAPTVKNSQPALEQEQAEVKPEDVPAELRDKFSLAIQATENNAVKSPRRSSGAPAADVSELAISIRQSIPSISFEAHVYATSSRQRWVKANGKTLQENQWLTADIKIKEIKPQYVLLEYGDTLFSMVALSSWDPS